MPRGWAWFMRLVLAVSLFALVFLALARSFQAVHSGSVEDLRLSRGGSSGEHFADDDRAATYSNDDRAAAHFTSTTAMSAAAAGDRDRDTAQETPSLRVQLSAAEQRQLSALSNEWKTVLRALPSHFSEDADDGGNAAASATGAALDADKYGGRKHVVMQELKNMLVPGVSAELLWESMGRNEIGLGVLLNSCCIICIIVAPPPCMMQATRMK